MSAFRNPLDADEQLSLFGENLGDYTDTQLNWIQDSNSTSQQLNFDNLPFVNVLTSFNDAFVTVPIEITGSGIDQLNASQLCMAAGVESIFTNVQFQLSSGSTILNEVNNQSSFINPIRKQIEWSLDKLATYGSENLYEPNDVSDGNSLLAPRGLKTQFTAAGTATLTATIPAVIYTSYYNGMPVQVISDATDSVIPAALLVNVIYYYFKINTTTFSLATTYANAIAGTGITVSAGTSTYSIIPVISGGTPFPYAPTTTTGAALGGGVAQQTQLFNLGFSKAVKKFQAQIVTRTSTTGLSLLLKIYLRDIHDIFKNLTFPMINFRWGLQLGLAWPWNSNSTIHSLLQATSGTSINNAAITNLAGSTAFAMGVCRLYQRQIKLNPMAELKLSGMLDAGYTKRVHFLETELGSTVFQTTSSTAQVNFQIATNSTNVKRVIVFGVPQGQFTSSTTPFTASVISNAPWCTSPAARLSAATLLVNQQPLYTRPLSLDNEFYMELRNQFVDSGLSMKSGSLITYQNWKLGTQLYYVFDLSRIRNRTSTEQPINLYFQGTRASVTAPYDQSLDWYAIMEKDAIVDFSVSRSSAQVMRVL
jgi:hypothetical protein